MTIDPATIDPADDLAIALRLADVADSVTLPHFRNADFTLGWKDDRTEVTEADRDAETELAATALRLRPEVAFVGEEHGRQGPSDTPWTWIVDPIDGTSGFVRGIPVWATLIALVHADSGVTTAVVSAPALGRRWWAARGIGSFADGRRCRVSDVDTIEAAQISITFNDGWDRLGLTPALVDLARRARRPRGFGDFWQHCLVAEGAVDAAIDAVGVKPHDLAAVRLIVEEAGGTFTDRNGTSTHDSDTAVSSNGRLHAEVLAALAGP
ncbi:MAG: inositol monophosphatase family protein [Ilumatobacteraceae bacterium]